MKQKSSDDKGLIHVYTGNGKGKTTASLGLCLRALGHNKKIHIIQLMKGGRYYGEIETIENLLPNIEISQFG
ncbi:MAG: cob(I)yrinic acid a,c-diamide adenosyltransferase, partial [Minisyncoccales bacterium]